jgi:hypothetical protein
MYVGGWYPIEFVAGPDEAALAQESEDAELTRSRPIFVSKTMRVTLLSDPNFRIRPKSKALQETGEDLAASWQWDVKPLAGGKHTLIAQVEVLRRGTGSRLQVVNRYSRRVSVSVGVGTFQSLLNGIRNAETIGEATASLFEAWRAALVALLALLVAFFGVRALIRRHHRRRSKPRQELGETEDTAGSS